MSPAHTSCTYIRQPFSERSMDDRCNRAPGPHWDFFSTCWLAGGEREAFLLVSTGEAAPDGNPDVIPLQGAGELTEEDRRKLDSQGVPPDSRDDVSIVRARFNLDPDLELSREEVSMAGRELTRGYVIGQLEDFFNSVEKPGGIVLKATLYLHSPHLQHSHTIQLLSTTLVMRRRERETGASVMASSPSGISSTSTTPPR